MRSRTLFSFDIWLLLATAGLMAIGVLFVYSSGVSSTGVVLSNEYIKQIIWIGLGLGIVVAFIFSNYSRIGDFAPYIYGFFMLLLVATLGIGKVVNGARSWIPFFGFGIQPSEFAKIGTILFLAYYLDRNRGASISLLSFIRGFAIVVIPILLILLQPDMGTALVYIPIFLVMAFVAGCPARYIFFLLGSGILLMVFSIIPAWQSYIADREYVILSIFSHSEYALFSGITIFIVVVLSAIGHFALRRRYFYWMLYASSIVAVSFAGSFALRRVLEDYQILRMIVFIDPGIDPQGAGWNVIQSVTAVGSGGWFGKGWLHGTQSHYRFIPQQSTDFIFSIITEEWGFLGGMLVFFLFSVILSRGFVIMLNARDRFAALVCSGIIGMFGFHILINIGMAMGIMPVTGIPLFFLSYGGSSLLTALIGIGLLMNIHIRRYTY